MKSPLFLLFLPMVAGLILAMTITWVLCNYVGTCPQVPTNPNHEARLVALQEEVNALKLEVAFLRARISVRMPDEREI